MKISVEMPSRIRQWWFQTVEAFQERWRRLRFNGAARLHMQLLRGPQKTNTLDGITTGSQQLSGVAWLWCDRQLMIDQPLMPLPTGSQTQPMLTKADRCFLAVNEAVGQLSAHDGSVGIEPRSVVVK